MNHEFYEHLIESDEFCLYMGRLTLLVSKLESRLKEIIIASEVKVRIKLDKPTLGPLIGCCKEHQLVNKDVVFFVGLHIGTSQLRSSQFVPIVRW
ncbi:hypothetical protein ACOMICROBIO_GDFFDHBD_03333 [Vibrio sp. B1REV9]|nr:hypothetical protein ACOMICROBIO_GDFFDHBD_03333 [Vibrio sp. B1REV9]